MLTSLPRAAQQGGLLQRVCTWECALAANPAVLRAMCQCALCPRYARHRGYRPNPPNPAALLTQRFAKRLSVDHLSLNNARGKAPRLRRCQQHDLQLHGVAVVHAHVLAVAIAPG